MQNRGVWFSLVGLGAILVILFPRSSSLATGGDRDKAVAAPSKSAANGPIDGIGEYLLDRYRGRQIGADALVGLDAFIATLPDPIDSHSDWAYDSGVEAIRQAFQRAGFVLDGFWIPPRDSTVADTATKWKVAIRERRPAVFLFKQEADLAPPNLRLVYVVTELPTSGIYKEAFRYAVAERSRLLGEGSHCTRPASDTLRIIGPTFSGSAQSLRRAIAASPELQTLPIHITTGSATNDGITAILGNSRTKFDALVRSDREFDDALERLVLTPLGVRRDQVALLAETSTAYGQGIDSAVSNEKGADSGRMLRIQFPANIATVRQDYETTIGQQAADPLDDLGKLARITVSLQEEDRPRETPVLTSRLSAATIDRVVEQILETIRHNDIRVVGLMATDVRDKLFLAERIRSQVRDVQFYTNESNLLLLQEDRGRALRGTLVFSTYPLVPELTANTDRDRLFFANESAQGIFNATLLQLNRPTLLIGYGSRDSLGRRDPPVTLTAVGRGRFIPLGVFWPSRNSGYATKISRDSVPSSIGLGPAAFGIRACFTIGGLVVAMLALQLMGNQARPDGSSLHREEARYLVLRQIWAAVGFLSLALAVVPQDFLPSSHRWPLQAGFAVLVAVISLRSIVRAVRLESAAQWWTAPLPAPEKTHDRWHRAGRRTRWIPEWVVFGFGLLLIVGLLMTIVQASRRPSVGFLLRIAHLRDGWSLVAPLAILAIGMTVFSWWNAIRSAAVARHTALQDAYREHPGQNEPFQLPIGPKLAETERRLGLVHNDGPMAVFWALALVTTGWVASQIGPVLEGADTGWVSWGLRGTLMLGVSATFLAIGWTVFEMTSVWNSLTRTLGTVANHPIVTAFERLPPRVARLPRMGLPRMGPTTDVADAVANQQWCQLANIANANGSTLKSTFASKATTLSELFDPLVPKPAKGPRGSVSKLIDVLAEAWGAEPDATDLGKLKEAIIKEDRLDPRLAGTGSRIRRMFASDDRVWVRLAEEYIAVRIVEYTESVLVQIRGMALFLMVSLVMTTALLSSYHFFPAGEIKLLYLFVLLATVGAVVWMMIQISRNEVLSRITKTEPGEISWDTAFVLNLVIFAVLPLLSLVTSEFPVVRGAIASIAKPLTDAMNHF